jgi:phosphate butyryltransferase
MGREIRNLESMLEAAKAAGPVPVAVACGHDLAALQALLTAEKHGLASSLLVGDAGQIGPAIRALPERLRSAEIVDAATEEEADRLAVELVRNGQAGVLLKGKTKTATLLHAALDRETGLRTGSLLSDAFLFEYQSPEGTRLVCISDGGINVSPDLDAKRQILLNAVEVYHALGVEKPRVACVSAVETVIPGHRASEDAAALAKMAEAGDLGDCLVEGPLSLDLAVSPHAVALKGHRGPVAGYADILLCPDIVSANLLAKSTTYFAKAPLTHIIMGSKAPILIPSRSDTPSAKLHSIALAVLMLKKVWNS